MLLFVAVGGLTDDICFDGAADALLVANRPAAHSAIDMEPLCQQSGMLSSVEKLTLPQPTYSPPPKPPLPSVQRSWGPNRHNRPERQEQWLYDGTPTLPNWAARLSRHGWENDRELPQIAPPFLVPIEAGSRRWRGTVNYYYSGEEHFDWYGNRTGIRWLMPFADLDMLPYLEPMVPGLPKAPFEEEFSRFE